MYNGSLANKRICASFCLKLAYLQEAQSKNIRNHSLCKILWIRYHFFFSVKTNYPRLVQYYKILHKLWDIRYFSIEKWTTGTFCCPLTVTLCDFFCLIEQKRAAVPNEEKPGLFYLRHSMKVSMPFPLGRTNGGPKYQI